MRICFYTPFKPLGHAHPSGDLIIATGIFDYLINRGHRVKVISDFRARWIYWKPWRWPRLLAEQKRAARCLSKSSCDLWFTYHTYYKAPDLLGPCISTALKIPYVIFQGIYATKRKKKLRTWSGFILNKKALGACRHVFTNKRVDLVNLGRLLPLQKISYVGPGIYPREFCFDARARAELRQSWRVGPGPVVLSAAMFRPGVKTRGISGIIQTCGRLFKQGIPLHLVIAGDGRERAKLNQLAAGHLPGRVRFLGKLPRSTMYRFYSAGDVFAFPGISESLGMVFLEAQSCGLPVVAFKNSGIPEVVQDGKTGLLVPLGDYDRFLKAIKKMLTQAEIRAEMGAAARIYVRENHDLNTNYHQMEKTLETIVRSASPGKFK